MGKHRQPPERCSVCNGQGEVKQSLEGDGGPKEVWVKCDACNGSGTQP